MINRISKQRRQPTVLELGLAPTAHLLILRSRVCTVCPAQPQEKIERGSARAPHCSFLRLIQAKVCFVSPPAISIWSIPQLSVIPLLRHGGAVRILRHPRQRPPPALLFQLPAAEVLQRGLPARRVAGRPQGGVPPAQGRGLLFLGVHHGGIYITEPRRGRRWPHRNPVSGRDDEFRLQHHLESPRRRTRRTRANLKQTPPTDSPPSAPSSQRRQQ